MSRWIKLFTSAHIFIYRVTNGWVGSQLGRQSMLLLTTKGRKSGKTYTTSLSYYRDGERYLIAGSNWGKESQPDWYYNLLKQPRTTIQVRSSMIAVEAKPAQDDEYQRLWQLVTAKNGQFSSYQEAMERRIPIVVLTPAKSV